MKNSYLNLFAIILTGVSLNVNSQCVSNEANVYPFVYNGENYEIVKENLSWGAAANCAVARGGFLAEIDSQEEQDSIFFHMNLAGINASNTIAPDGGNASYLWIGGNDLGVEGDWVWDGDNTGTSEQFWQGTSSGSPVGGLYNNWGNEPDNWNNQDGLGFSFTDWPLGVAGQWNDVNDGNTLYYIIEYSNGGIGLNEINTEPTFIIYPNPSDETITISSNSFLFEIRIYNLSGLLVNEVQISSTEQIIDISKLNKGVYIVEMINDADVRESKRIIIQ